jgi:PAS domain S-box-containing protein
MKRRIRRRLRRQREGWTRIAIVALLMALTVAVSIVQYLRAFEERAVATAGEQLTMVAATVGDDVDALLLERSHALALLAHELGRDGELGARAAPALLRAEQDGMPDVQLVDLADRAGRIVATTRPESFGRDESERIWFTAARDGAGARIFGPHFDELAPNDLTIGLTAPVLGDDGRFLGVVREELSLSALLYRVRRRVRVIGDDATRTRALEWILLDHDGLIIAESDLAEQGRINMRQIGLQSALRAAPGWIREEHGRLAADMVTGYAELGFAGQGGSLPWRVLVRVQERDVLKPMRFLLGRLVGIVSVVLMPLALLLGRLVIERRRAEKQLRAAHGQLEERIADRTQELSRANAALEGEVRERRRTEDALREREAQLADFFENAPVGLHWLGPDGVVLRANRAELTMLGYDATEYVGHDVREFHVDPYVIEEFLARLARGETLDAREARVRCKDGSIRTVLVDANVLWRDGAFVHARCFTRDVTEQQRVKGLLEQGRERAEQQARALERQTLELEQARNEALAAARAKAAFLANMSHEIRTPMTAILGYAELLSDRRLSPRIRQDYVKTVRHNGEYLLRLLNDVLDLSKLEAGKMTVEHVPCSPAHLAGEVEAMLRGRAVGSGLRLDLVVGPDVPGGVLSDPTRIRQILVNLVGNAIKFTYAGSVRLAVACDGVSDGRARVRFTVTDTGIGMTPEEQARLFAPFVQADTSTSRRFGGTGLGLTISSRLAEVLGGSLAVTSTPGGGSTFTLALDVDVAPAAAFPARVGESPALDCDPEMPRLRGRILLAEDAPDSQRLLAFFMRRAGATVEVVDNGRQACDRVREALEVGATFDLIVMDMQMPEMDGYQATVRLRGMGVRTPILALTAHSMDGDRERCLDVGCTDYLAKPIERLPFLRRVRDHLDAVRVTERPAKPNGTIRRAGSPEIADQPDLMLLFVAGLRERAAAFEATLERRDLDGLAGLAHQLKGTARAYGFPQLTDQAAALEASLIAGRCLDDVRTQVECVVELCRAAGCQ